MFFINGQPSDKIMTLDKFPDNTPKIEIDIVRMQIWYKSQREISIKWKFESMEELFTLQVLVMHLREKGLQNICLNLFYVPTARMDRAETFKDVPLLKYFCNIINSLEFNHVAIYDPHSSVLPNLLNRCIVRSTCSLILKSIEQLEKNGENIDCLFFPDTGSLKRYLPTVSYLNRPYISAYKYRDWETGEIQKLDILKGDADLTGKNVLIIDDICSKGGTFYYSGKALKELGVNKIYLWVTHCENSILDGKLLTADIIDRIFTTDSLLTKTHEKITTINIVDTQGEE